MICGVQSNVDDKIIPRCLCVTTLSIYFPQKTRAGELQRNLFENIKDLVFFALNVTFQVFAHDSIFDKSRLRIEVVSAGSLPTARSDVSSANKRNSDSRSF